ncbi:dihydroorotate dehydrogenase electron transfer subunit [Bacteroidales bacterium OttesenSCG-928-A17]|nr:dihydroorotate dehydrogenase electron transfer subunit [Bacteroidales bacterium OttesenSCG-928-A17]
MSKKIIADWIVTENIRLNPSYFLLKLHLDQALPEMHPGQFVQVLVKNSPTTFLRRPISIHYVDTSKNEIWLLIQIAGDGTQCLSTLKPGDSLNVIAPLGNCFSFPEKQDTVLLIGGGVGIAPLLFFGYKLLEKGFKPNFLLGARSAGDLLQLDEFYKCGSINTTTEDGSHGEKGFVIHHSCLQMENYTKIYTCGPKPMMQAVAKYAKEKNCYCEVSLENTMACGIGACLCCVEKTTKGNVCVCTEGPVFNINQLTWPI